MTLCARHVSTLSLTSLVTRHRPANPRSTFASRVGERKRAEMESEKETVCVTGAGGFLASSAVQLLLSEGYIVHGTVRDPGNEKNAHLRKLEKASENLKLFKADLLDYDSLCSAIDGCTGVFHVASPVPSSSVPNPEVEVVEPAVKGTLNVLKACSRAGVRRVVYVSSIAAVMMNPSWPKNGLLDESCWSDKEYCRTTGNWYCLSKTEAESEAFDYAKRSGLNVVSVCPSHIIGPLLQPTLNSSSMVLLKLVKAGDEEIVPNKVRILVDVRDVAAAMLLVYNKPEAEGRYICVSHPIKVRDLVDKLRTLYPDLSYPTKFTEVDEEIEMNSARLQKLGWTYRPLEETLSDGIESFRGSGLLG